MEKQVIKMVLMTLSNLFGEISELFGTEKPVATPVTAPVAAPAPVVAPVAPAVVAPVAAPAPVVAPVAPAVAAPVAAPAPVVAPVAPAVAAPVAASAAPAVAVPVAAPVAPVAPAVAAPVAASAADVTLDTEGIPWDKRIHSSGKTFYARKAANGTPAGGWKLKKGVDAVTVAKIKTELCAQYSNTVTKTPVGVPLEPTAEFGSITTWGELMRQIVTNTVDRTIVDEKCVGFGISSLAELQNSPNLIPSVAQGLGLTKAPVATP